MEFVRLKLYAPPPLGCCERLTAFATSHLNTPSFFLVGVAIEPESFVASIFRMVDSRLRWTQPVSAVSFYPVRTYSRTHLDTLHNVCKR